MLRARADGQTLGLALGAERAARRLVFLPTRSLFLNAAGDPDLNSIYIEHNGFLCAVGDEPAAMAGLVGWVADKPSAVDALHLPGISFPVAANGMLNEVREEPGFVVDLARVLAAEGDIAALLGGTARQRLRRNLRAYEEAGALAITEARSLGEALEFFLAMKAFHIASWQRRRRRHAFSTPYFERFHRALIEREFAAGAVQMLEVASGGRAIGYLYNFRRDGVISAYQSGFDDRDPRLSPGVASHALAIRFNAERGASRYDFLAGANRLKESFATDRYTLCWQVLRHPHLDYRIEAAMRRLKREII